MGIKEVLRFFLIMLSFAAFSELLAENHEKAGYGLFLSPENCVILNKSAQCEIIVYIEWKVKKIGNYCLYASYQDTYIECWQAKKQAVKKTSITIEEDIHFELRQQFELSKNNIEQVINRATIKVYRKTSNLRRKRRNPWSFY